MIHTLKKGKGFTAPRSGTFWEILVYRNSNRYLLLPSLLFKFPEFDYCAQSNCEAGGYPAHAALHWASDQKKLANFYFLPCTIGFRHPPVLSIQNREVPASCPPTLPKRWMSLEKNLFSR